MNIVIIIHDLTEIIEVGIRTRMLPKKIIDLLIEAGNDEEITINVEKIYDFINLTY